jgi:hypothetical protein
VKTGFSSLLFKNAVTASRCLKSRSKAATSAKIIRAVLAAKVVALFSSDKIVSKSPRTQIRALSFVRYPS